MCKKTLVVWKDQSQELCGGAECFAAIGVPSDHSHGSCARSAAMLAPTKAVGDGQQSPVSPEGTVLPDFLPSTSLAVDKGVV